MWGGEWEVFRAEGRRRGEGLSLFFLSEVRFLFGFGCGDWVLGGPRGEGTRLREAQMTVHGQD